MGLAAASGVGLLRGDRARAADGASATVQASDAPPVHEATSPSKRKLAGLERRVAELELRAGDESEPTDGRSDASDAEREAAAAPPKPPVPYETVVAQWHGRLAAHAAEPRSQAFAQRWGTALEGDLAKLRGELPAGMLVSATDCRSSSCAVSVQWPSFAAAVAQYEELMNYPYGTNCWRDVILPKPEQGHEAEPYSTTLLFSHCKE